MEQVQKFLSQANSRLNSLYNNPYIASVLALFFILYAGLAAPDLPPVLANIFGNPIFKILFLFLILFLRNLNPTLAILLSIGFILSLQTFHRYQSFTMLNDLTTTEKMLQSELTTSEYNPVTSYFPQQIAQDDQRVPLPQSPVAELPSEQAWNTQVTGFGGKTCGYQGPQGLKHPFGFSGVVEGASYGQEHSEL